VRVSLGLSFHDKESFDQAVGTSLHFVVNDPNPIPEAGSTDQDRSPHDDDVNPLPIMGNINQERRLPELGSDDFQIILEIDELIESEDSQLHRRQYSVD
jgi:hypothetical protein